LLIKLSANSGVTTITLNRPNKANAYNRAMLEQLETALDNISTPVVVIESTGGGAFCGGADLVELDSATPDDAKTLRSQRVFQKIASAQWCSIAAVHGAAVAGGFELALACDLIVASDKATFSLPETSLGLIPSAGGTTRLPLSVGLNRAKDVILGGRVLDSKTALAWGIVSRVAKDARGEAAQWGEELASKDPTAMSLAKGLLNRETELSLRREREAEAVLYGKRNGF
jgi:enoyl-CoA hydratase/carnithine racemase